MNIDRLIVQFGAGVSGLPWQWILAFAHMALAALAIVHAMLFKRDPRAALGWVSMCLFFPLGGPVMYYMFGINRIKTQAHRLAQLRLFPLQVGHERGAFNGSLVTAALGDDPKIGRFVRVSDRVTARPLTAGNKVEMLRHGEQAYPAMLSAIDAAVDQVLMVTYLFETDSVGDDFVAALSAAHKRGVDVRVIVDGLGERYSRPRVSRALRRAGIRVARFLPPRLIPPTLYLNLRNHRKILVVDGAQAFTGGMNIGARHLVDSDSDQRTVDLHFRIRGPAVAQLETIFAEDWRFATEEALETGATRHKDEGVSYCRCISDGPNEDLDKIALVMMGVISAAQSTVTILTPYFLPSREMIASLQSAALRGVDVAVILPQRSNLRFIDWATRNLLWELLQYDVKIYYQPPPFAHTKLFVVDSIYAQIGSANLDPRSLRLNFELNMEIVGAESVAQFVAYANEIRGRCSALSLQQVDERSLPVRLRDAACWLFMPYL